MSDAPERGVRRHWTIENETLGHTAFGPIFSLAEARETALDLSNDRPGFRFVIFEVTTRRCGSYHTAAALEEAEDE